MNSIKSRLAYKLFIISFFVQAPLNLQNVFAAPQSKIFSASHQNVTKAKTSIDKSKIKEKKRSKKSSKKKR